jgi:hypothetical protein
VCAGLNVDAAVVRVDDLAHDRQPQAGALRLGREERIEDAIAQLFRHTGAVVGELRQDLLDDQLLLEPARAAQARVEHARHAALRELGVEQVLAERQRRLPTRSLAIVHATKE